MKTSYKPLIFIYKHNIALWLGWAILAGAVYILFLSTLPVFHDYVILIYLYFFAAIPLFYIIVSLYLKSVISDINSVLYNDCDPERYIEIYEHIIGGLKSKIRPRTLAGFEFLLGLGLTAAGRYSEAYKIMSKINPSENGRTGKLNSVVYYSNLISVCLKLGLADEAEENLDLLIKAVAVLKPHDYNKYKRFHLRAQYAVNIARGVYDYSEKAFAELFEASKSNYERVAAKFTLARIHLHYGDTPRAKEALEYVIAHGNKLYIVEEAKELISKLRSDEPGRLV